MKAKEYDFSVVIPVFNAEETIGKILEKISKYSVDYTTEVIIIDSESTDKTVDFVKTNTFKNIIIRYCEIKKRKFNHGNTRNLGVKLARGKYIIFLTKFATPANDIFTFFKEDLDKSSDCVAVFGQQLPNKNTFTFYDLELACQFKNLNDYTNENGLFIQSTYTLSKKPTPRELYLWYMLSNSFSCYKRSFLLQNPFPTIDYAEDLSIGKKIIHMGLKKIYDKRAQVYYSHPYSLYEYYQRQRIDYMFKTSIVKTTAKINVYKKIYILFLLDLPTYRKILILVLFPVYYLIKFAVYFEYSLKH